MRYYLSSYELGKETEKLKSLVPNNKIGYIPNARDFTGHDLEKREIRTTNDMNSLRELGIEAEEIDLRNYFGKTEELKNKITDLGAIFISGGNVFVLRQAMKLSGLDNILLNMKDDPTFLYAGYSAAGCVLYKDLHAYPIVDKPDTPYENQEMIWEGLDLVDFAFMPHWDSDHPESLEVGMEIEHCKQNSIPYKAIRDGEVIIIK